jgi:RND family efflux transporter MFP subunit
VGNVFEEDIHAIKRGQPVQVHLDSQPNTTYMGTVDMVGAMLEPQTRTLDIRVQVPNPNLTLKPNMFAHMNILTGQRHVLAIPKTAIQQNGDHTYVYVPVGPHQYEERQVNINMSDAPFVEVVSGLHSGEQVVSHGTLSLKGEALKEDTKSQQAQ